MTVSLFNLLSLVWRKRLWCGPLLLAALPLTAFAESWIVEDFENYRDGVLSSPWHVSDPQGSAAPGQVAITNTLAALGEHSLDISGEGYVAHYEGSFQKQDILLNFGVNLPAGLNIGEMAGGVAFGGVKIFFMMDRKGVYRVYPESAPTAALSGFKPGKWYKLLLHIDQDHTTAELESGPVTSELFTYQVNENGGPGSDLTFFGGKGMHIDALSLEAKHHDYLIDSDNDGHKDYLDPDDDNDGIVDERDRYPLDPLLQFREDWENGFSSAVWETFGGPRTLVHAGEGRQGGGAFVSEGSAQFASGAASRASFDLFVRPELSFWMRGKSSKAYWQNLKVAWSYWDNSSEGTLQSLVSFVARPENSSENFQYCVANDCFSEAWRDDDHHDTWLFCKISINHNGTVSFYRDGQKLWTSRAALDLESLPKLVIELSGQSYQDLQLLDDVTVTLPDETSVSNELSNWRRWEGLSGAVDKPLTTMQRNQEEDITDPQSGQVPAAFYTSEQQWSAGQLEFDFRLSGQAVSYAPAFFYRNNLSWKASQVKVQLSEGVLRAFRWDSRQFVELATLAYAFQPGITYRLLVDQAQATLSVFQDDKLLASTLNPPTLLEASRLAGPNQLLLTWLPPTNETFSHVNVYRSEEADQKGLRLADHITGMTFVDESSIPGTTYFYKLYPVDTSGRESRRAAELTQFRFNNNAIARPLSSLAADELPLAKIKGNSTVTVPLRLDSELVTDNVPKGVKLLELHPAQNRWVDAARIERGRGYFVQGENVGTTIEGQPFPAKLFEVSLQRGWNVIGNPFLERVAVEQILVTVEGKTRPFLEAVKEGWIADYLSSYLSGKWYIASVFETGLMLHPWQGVYLLSKVDALLTVPPVTHE